MQVHKVGLGLTAEQKTIADYWADNAGDSGTPPGHWIDIVSQIARRDNLSLTRAAEAYARVGIAAEHIPRLTERFYRVDRSRSRETGGTGLGLAIAKHALARHDATLEIESTPGKGSRFSARFPARRLASRNLTV